MKREENIKYEMLNSEIMSLKDEEELEKALEIKIKSENDKLSPGFTKGLKKHSSLCKKKNRANIS